MEIIKIEKETYLALVTADESFGNICEKILFRNINSNIDNTKYRIYANKMLKNIIEKSTIIENILSRVYT